MKNIRVVIGAGALLWAAALPLAALAASADARAAVEGPGTTGFQSVRSLFEMMIYATGAVVCHQQPWRSLQWGGAAWPVCARCTGIYGAAALTVVACAFTRFSRADVASGFSRTSQAAVAPGSAFTPRLMLALALVPTILTVVWEWTTGTPTSNALRVAAGAPIGAAVAWIVMQSG